MPLCCYNDVAEEDPRQGSTGKPFLVRMLSKFPLQMSVAERMLFPMWVFPIQIFLAMEGPPKSFQDLMEENLLVRWTMNMYTIFCSHQWLGNTSADPDGKQLQVLRAALKNILRGDIVVQSGMMQFLALGVVVDEIGAEEVQRIHQGYIWFDWFSIPQISVRSSSSMEDILPDVQKAVESIPAYVEAADMFVALVPCTEHRDRHVMCSQKSWESRGWCRVELAAAALSTNTKTKILMVASEVMVSMFAPFQCGSVAPGLGDFTVDSDRELIFPVMQEIIQRHVETLWTEGVHYRARLFEAMRGSLMQNLSSDPQQQEAATVAAHEGLEDFLVRFHFNSIQDALQPSEMGIGPVACAAVAGNLFVLQLLVAAKADANEAFSQTVPELLLEQGMTPLTLTAKLTGDRAVLRELVRLRADLHVKDCQQITALNHAILGGHVDALEELLQLGSPVNELSHVLQNTPLLSAAAQGDFDCIQVLLKHRASVDAVNILGYTPLTCAAFLGSRECCELFLQLRADVNKAITPPKGLLSWALPLGIRAACSLGLFPAQGPLRDFLLIEGSTSIFSAAAYGHTELVRLLLASRADPSTKNAAGLSASDVARSRKAAPELLELLHCA